VGSYQPLWGKVPFQLWELEVDLEAKKGKIEMREDQDECTLVEQHLPYTDFPLGRMRLYCQNNVLFLPSEY
jgi:hypothetical protein